jgi:hypothetical protein
MTTATANYCTYPAVRELKRLLGYQDTLVDLSELALRHFERSMSRSGSPRDFVERMRRRYSIGSSLGAEWAVVRANSSRFAIVQVYAVIDSTFRELSREYRLYKRITPEKWISKGTDGRQLDALAALTANLDRSRRPLILNAPEFEVLEYYRAFRNAVAHPSRGAVRATHSPRRDLERLRVQLVQQHGDYLRASYGLVPATFAEAGHDDFLLLTRGVKRFAQVLNEACALAASDVAQALLSDVEFVAALRACKGSPGRLESHIARLRGRFRIPADQMAEFRTRINAFLATDPPRRIRVRARSRQKSG